MSVLPCHCDLLFYHCGVPVKVSILSFDLPLEIRGIKGVIYIAPHPLCHSERSAAISYPSTRLLRYYRASQRQNGVSFRVPERYAAIPLLKAQTRL